jgi:hypothetical protein
MTVIDQAQSLGGLPNTSRYSALLLGTGHYTQENCFGPLESYPPGNSSVAAGRTGSKELPQ